MISRSRGPSSTHARPTPASDFDRPQPARGLAGLTKLARRYHTGLRRLIWMTAIPPAVLHHLPRMASEGSELLQESIVLGNRHHRGAGAAAGSLASKGVQMRIIGLDVDRWFAEVAILETGSSEPADVSSCSMSRSSPSQDGRPAVLRLVEVVEPGIAWDKPFLQMHLQLDRPLSHDFGKKALELLVVRQAKQRNAWPAPVCKSFRVYGQGRFSQFDARQIVHRVAAPMGTGCL